MVLLQCAAIRDAKTCVRLCHASGACDILCPCQFGRILCPIRVTRGGPPGGNRTQAGGSRCNGFGRENFWQKTPPQAVARDWTGCAQHRGLIITKMKPKDPKYDFPIRKWFTICGWICICCGGLFFLKAINEFIIWIKWGDSRYFSRETDAVQSAVFGLVALILGFYNIHIGSAIQLGLDALIRTAEAAENSSGGVAARQVAAGHAPATNTSAPVNSSTNRPLLPPPSAVNQPAPAMTRPGGTVLSSAATQSSGATMTCPFCSTAINFAPAATGQEAACPQCGETILLLPH